MFCTQKGNLFKRKPNPCHVFSRKEPFHVLQDINFPSDGSMKQSSAISIMWYLKEQRYDCTCIFRLLGGWASDVMYIPVRGASLLRHICNSGGVIITSTLIVESSEKHTQIIMWSMYRLKNTACTVCTDLCQRYQACPQLKRPRYTNPQRDKDLQPEFHLP